MLIDCHLHLQDGVLLEQIAAVLGRARAAGVRALVTNGTREGDWPLVRQLAKKYPEVFPCFGLHPWYVAERSAHWLVELEQCLDEIPSAVGEIGLDRWIEPRDEAAQEEVFRAQLAVARRRALPATIHCVRAWDWLMQVLRSEAPLPAGMLLHAYGGPVELIQPLAELGAYFSYAGTTLAPRNHKRRETLRHIPAERLLVETDAPDLLPPPSFCAQTMLDAEGRQRNEPANLPLIVEGIAALLSESPNALAQRVERNARTFFRQLPPP